MITRRGVQKKRGLAAGAALAFLATACGGGSGSAPRETAVTTGPPTIDVVRVVEQPLNVILSLPGELLPYQTVAIHPRVTGFVRTIRVDRGSRVRAGEILATLEAPELLAQRSEAQSKLHSEEAGLAAVRSRADAEASTYENLKAASSTPGVVAGNDLVVAGKAVETVRSQVVAAQQNVEAARQALNALTEIEGYLRVTAPFDGVVTERNVHPGALVGPTTDAGAAPMVRLVEEARLRLVVSVPEAYTASVAIGAHMPFSVAAYPGQTFSGTVARMARAVDVASRTMAVELDVANSDGRLAPGTYSQVRWPMTRPGPSLMVPSGSVASTTDRTFVVRIRDGKVEWVDVRTGLASGLLVEVFGDLKAGELVAGRGTDEMRPGTEVHVKELAPAAS